MALVEVDAVFREFAGKRNVAALSGVSLRVEAGERVALMGPSGAGKSTLLHLIGALDRPTSGVVRIAGVELGPLADAALSRLRRTQIGFVFQSFHLLPTLAAWENVALPLHLAGRPRREARRRALELLSQLGLAQRAEHLPAELAGGEQQRVAIARALSLAPPLLLADEPTGNLDSEASAEVIALLARLHASFGTTLVVATHNPEVAGACDRRITLRDGRIVAEARASARIALSHQPS